MTTNAQQPSSPLGTQGAMSARQLSRLARAKGKEVDPLLGGALNEQEEESEESQEEAGASLVSAAAVSAVKAVTGRHGVAVLRCLKQYISTR